MKRFALLAAFGAVLVSSVVIAQVRQNGRLLLGDTSTPIRMNGKLETNASIFPLDTTFGFTVDGGMTVVGTVAVNGATALKVNRTTCTLNAASPSTCNGAAAMPAGSTCTCSLVGATAAIAAKGCAIGLSGTTVTAVSANAATEVVNFTCL